MKYSLYPWIWFWSRKWNLPWKNATLIKFIDGLNLWGKTLYFFHSTDVLENDVKKSIDIHYLLINNMTILDMYLQLFCVNNNLNVVVLSFHFIVTLYKLLNCFSLIKNTNFILNTNVGKNDLTYLHGIRVLSLFWIILVHLIGDLIPLPFTPTKGEQCVL